MISVDTNVLVRTVVNDNPVQSATARELLQKNVSGAGVRIPLVVLVETVWVLLRRYKRSKQELLTFLERLISINKISLERKREVKQAISDWRKGKADFTDYVILAVSAADGCTTTYTFEKKRMAADPRATMIVT